MSLGTSGTVYACADEPVIDPQGHIAAFCSSTGGWLPLLCTMNCTVSTELVRALLGADLSAFEAQIGSAARGSDGVLTLPFWCFHDFDLAFEGSTLGESERNLREMVTLAGERQNATGVSLLWGTANLFSHPRYMNGASTNPDFEVVAYAAAQVKAALDATVELGGRNYVFWGGREGYACLHNTDTRRERGHMAIFLEKARDYGRSIGFDFRAEMGCSYRPPGRMGVGCFGSVGSKTFEICSRFSSSHFLYSSLLTISSGELVTISLSATYCMCTGIRNTYCSIAAIA